MLSSEYRIGSPDVGSTTSDSPLRYDSSLAGGGGGGGGGVLVLLGSGGGGASDGCSLVGGGTAEPGLVPLLPCGTGLGVGTSLERGSGCKESLVGGSGGLIVLGSGGGKVDSGETVSLSGSVEPGPASLLGSGFGGLVSLDAGPGVLGLLAWSDSLVGGGVLVPLGSGDGGNDVSDRRSLGGVTELSRLLPGRRETGDASALGGAVLDNGPGVLGIEVGD